ncbi:glycosyl transferase family protein [Beutenbergia cavernae DSM 12333]|uniref:Glycosyl transferase family protein n=1 Tax=Beutenbergia cavernae (strain ATCC BAA-8 / DSM 12333 / CCUG 43141 / JCM 11478 / NBRC 16432 / NCIMB 13614 / HKI 0122) TaxID=471853 RepID=C5C1L1_BEUC1|nr:glycosyltransferase [Beutenbergia cavernae]ACQ79479.1 glycosyl transferase family protein [Beutenbergia cavernae DSM 12333]
MNTLQNVVLPIERDADLLALYVDAREPGPLVAVEEEIEAEDLFERLEETADREASAEESRALDGIGSRHRIDVAGGDTLSFATYFNAFPASYWRRWTAVRHVRLVLELAGAGTVHVHRSDATGESTLVASERVATSVDDGVARVSVDLDLRGFGKGGWYWFDLAAEAEGLSLHRGRWETDAAPLRTGKVCLGITTVNKADYCVASLRRLADDADMLDDVDVVYVVDQGTKKLRDEPGFDEVAARLGDQLEVIEQANLGGSGGFSRSMLETLKRPEADFVLLLDDDVVVETESVLRAVRFARHTSQPVIVGGHMFDLNHRSVLHAYSEIVDMGPFMWGSRSAREERHDFATASLRETGWLHRRQESDYNGWWMCLIPTVVLEDVGLAAPLFLKWDDSEFGLRAKHAGYPTVSMPGVALWHISWLDKDDGIEWQAYFHERNRVISALLQSEAPGGGWLLQDSQRQDVKHLVSMQYYTVALRHAALRDVLAGPDVLHDMLPGRIAEVRAMTASHPETVRHDPEDIPAPTAWTPRYRAPMEGWPRGWRLGPFTAVQVLRHGLLPAPASAAERPQVEFAPRYGTWWRVPRYDSALVPTADRTARYWYRRDRAKFRRQLLDSVRLHRRVRRDWDGLSETYRSALARITSPEAWAATFGVDAPAPLVRVSATTEAPPAVGPEDRQ